MGRTVEEHRQAGRQRKSPQSTQEPGQGQGPLPAAHFSFLLGKVDLPEASPPYTLWLPELAPSQHRQHRGGGADLLQDPRAGVSSGGRGV